MRAAPTAFGGPTASSRREQALTRVAELEYLAETFAAGDKEKVDGIRLP